MPSDNKTHTEHTQKNKQHDGQQVPLFVVANTEPDLSKESTHNNMPESFPQQQQSELSSSSTSNVINIFTGQASISSSVSASIVRIVPEASGIRMLYANVDQPDRLVAVPLLAWALDDCGDIVGLVPWLDEILPCQVVADKFSVLWEGYYCAASDEIFFEPGEEIISQLTLSARYNKPTNKTIETGLSQPRTIIQEIADPVGTHALLLNEDNDSLLLTSVISWALDEDGQLHGMLADDNAIDKLPVLPGDACLYSADQAENFRCFFQRDIAEQIRTQHPETLEAIEHLFVN